MLRTLIGRMNGRMSMILENQTTNKNNHSVNLQMRNRMKGALSDTQVEEHEGGRRMHGEKDAELTPILEAKSTVLWMCREREKGMEGTAQTSSGVIWKGGPSKQYRCR